MRKWSLILPFLLLFVGVLLLSKLSAQNVFRPYQPSSSTTAPVLGIGGSLVTVSTYFGSKVEVLSEDQIKSLDQSRIWGVDRYSLGTYSLAADEWTDKLLVASFASPFFVLLSERGRNNFNDIGLVVFQGAVLNAGLNNFSKVFGKRTRPYVYNPDVPLHIKQKKSSRYSFYSGHSATSAYFSITAAKLYNDLYPDSKARPYVWATAALIPAFVSYGRMKGGRHFFTDVLVGTLVGSAIAIIIPELNK